MTVEVRKTNKNKKTQKFQIDLSIPLKDELLVGKEFVDFLKSNIKVNGKKGNLGEEIAVSLVDQKVVVNSKIALCKRYLKYLTKKYLKKNDIIDYLRVIASNKTTYTIKYLNIGESEEKEEQ